MGKNNSLKTWCRVILGAACFYVLVVVALWYIYSMRTMVSGGAYTLAQAKSLVLQMALVATSLTVVGSLFAHIIFGKASGGKVTAACSLATGLMLTAYTAINFLWRGSWQPGSGRAQFLPPWSDLNAHFFYEYNWLSYLLFLTPVAMILSGCISFWLWRNLNAEIDCDG
jgi:hypothetical protein